MLSKIFLLIMPISDLLCRSGQTLILSSGASFWVISLSKSTIFGTSVLICLFAGFLYKGQVVLWLSLVVVCCLKVCFDEDVLVLSNLSEVICQVFFVCFFVLLLYHYYFLRLLGC